MEIAVPAAWGMSDCQMCALYYTKWLFTMASHGRTDAGAGAGAQSVCAQKAKPPVLGLSEVGTFGNRSAVLLHRTFGLRNVVLEDDGIVEILACDR